MMIVDPEMLLELRRQELLEEAKRERLISQLPHRDGAVRRSLAQACVKLANWLDAPAGYVQLPDPGPEDLTAPWAAV
jgi:hypothetical protein